MRRAAPREVRFASARNAFLEVAAAALCLLALAPRVDAASGLRSAGIYDANGRDMRLSPDGRHLYTAGFEIFERDEVSGALGLVETLVGELERARALEIAPDGRHVHFISEDENALASFARDAANGRLEPKSVLRDGVTNVEGLDQPVGLALSPDGAHLYVVAIGFRFGCTLAVFAVDPETGEASFVEVHRDRIDGVAGLTQPLAVSVTPDGERVLASSSQTTAIFRRLPATGRLIFDEVVEGATVQVAGIRGAAPVSQGGASCASSPRVVALSPDGRTLYGASYDLLCVSELDAETPAPRLIQVLQRDPEEIGEPDALAVSPDGADLYLLSSHSRKLVHFARVENVPTVTATATFSVTRTPSATPTVTRTITPGGPTLTRTRTVTPTCTCNRPPLIARATAKPDVARSGQRVLLDGSASSGKRVNFGTWTQLPGGPVVQLTPEGTTNASFRAPSVTRPIRLGFTLTIDGLGGRLQTQASTSTSVLVLADGAASPPPTPTKTEVPTVPTASATRTPTATPTPPARSPTSTPTASPSHTATAPSRHRPRLHRRLPPRPRSHRQALPESARPQR